MTKQKPLKPVLCRADNKVTWNSGEKRICIIVENSIVVPKAIKHGITIWPGNVTSGYTSESIENRDSDDCISIFTVAKDENKPHVH